jgi:Protein of unknown function (DUF3108)
MPLGFSSRLARVGFISVLGLTCLSPVSAKAADGWPGAVKATYDVNFNGLNVGTYEFNSTQDGHTYKLTGNAQLSLLLGALRWTGATETTGRLSGETAKPSKFGFEFTAQSKVGSTHMSFTDDTVTQVFHNPPPKLKEGVVPVQAQHLKGVLDPLTAVLAISRGTADNPCSRRIPIYDGTQRFDLMLSPKGQVQLQDARPSGQPTTGYVCRVRYVPIAGYKPDDSTKYLAQNNDIEIVLRPLPSANIFVPYSVTIPTMAGNATLVARRVNVVSNGQQQIALVH